MTAIVTYHPTFALFYQPYEAGTFEVDINRFSRLIHGELEEYPKKTKVNATIKDLERLIKFAKKNFGGEISLDIETSPESYDIPWTGKDPTRARLKTIGFGCPVYGISFWMKDVTQAELKVLKQTMERADILFVLQNGPWFDLRVLARYGFFVRRWVDTRDLRRALSNTSRLSLGYQTSIYTDMWNWKGDVKIKDDKGTLTKVPPKQLMLYNGYDCACTSRVYRKQKADLKAVPPDYKPVVKRLYNVHKKLSIICAEMHTTGIPFSKKNRKFMLHCTKQALREKRRRLIRLVNDENFRPTDHGMRSLLFERHKKPDRKNFGLPDPTDKNLWTNEKKESVSVDENSLLMWMASGDMPTTLFPIIEAWWETQGQKKRLGYLASRLIDEALGNDNRLRPGWNSCGTDTMRFSCSEPNVMNIEQVMRYMFAPEPGWCIVHADKSQLELRVMEVVANDTVLKQALDTGDVYSFDARAWFQLPEGFDVKKLKPDSRKSAKVIHLARQYRAGLKAVFAQALKEDRRFSFERVRALTSAFDTTYYGTVNYWDAEMEFVAKFGYSYGRIIGGRHHYPAMPEPSEVANKPIQRTAAEMMNLELIDLHERLADEVPTAKIIIQLHDAIDVYCREKDQAKVSRIVTEVMDREWKVDGRIRRFPIEMKTAYYSKGGTWADV